VSNASRCVFVWAPEKSSCTAISAYQHYHCAICAFLLQRISIRREERVFGASAWRIIALPAHAAQVAVTAALAGIA